MILLCIALLLHLCSAKFQTISKHNPDIPAFLYSTVSSFRINAHAVLQINKPINQPEIEVYFSNLPLSYGNNDHLILVARTPPWRIMEAFQIVDKGCERKNCIQCTKNQECGMCERGHG